MFKLVSHDEAMLEDARQRSVNSLIYYEDHDCTVESRAIAHKDMIHQHFDHEHDALVAFVSYMRSCWEQLRRLGHTSLNMKYRCIRGPGGVVRGVR
jgi:hypothetical protein